MDTSPNGTRVHSLDLVTMHEAAKCRKRTSEAQFNHFKLWWIWKQPSQHALHSQESDRWATISHLKEVRCKPKSLVLSDVRWIAEPIGIDLGGPPRHVPPNNWEMPLHLSPFTTFCPSKILVCPPNIFNKSMPVAEPGTNGLGSELYNCSKLIPVILNIECTIAHVSSAADWSFYD